MSAPEAVTRLHAQGEILRRGPGGDASRALVALASDGAASLEGRAAAIFTLKQLDGKDAHPALLKLADNAAVREFALRALTDRKTELGGLTATPFVAALSDPSPRVRAQALISLGRLNDPSAAAAIVPLTSRPAGSTMPTQAPVQNQPDPDRVVPHLAARTLASLGAIDACLEALDGPHAQGSLAALRSMHNPKAVEGLIKKLGTVRDAELRRGILTTLIRLYHREADYNGSWWGIRPDNTGPYYDRVQWEMSTRIAAVVTAAVLDSDAETGVLFAGAVGAAPGGTRGAANPCRRLRPRKARNLSSFPQPTPKNPDQIGNMTYDVALRRTLEAKGDAAKGLALFKSQSCAACHTTADGQSPKGPHLVDIGKRYKADELVESILNPSAKIAQGYESYAVRMADGRVFTGFVVTEGATAIVLREGNAAQHKLERDEIERRVQQTLSAMPAGLVANLTPPELADLLAYLQSL